MNDETRVSPSEDVNSVVISRKHLDAASHVNSLLEAYTSGVSLCQARSIHFSRGDDGHCRSRDNVCGMLIRFWGADHPLILGQWIREIEGTCIELQQGETLTDIAIWYTQVTPSKIPPKIASASNYGRVAGIRLATSNGQVREIRFVNTQGTLFVQSRCNSFEEIVSAFSPSSSYWHYFCHLSQLPAWNSHARRLDSCGTSTANGSSSRCYDSPP